MVNIATKKSSPLIQQNAKARMSKKEGDEIEVEMTNKWKKHNPPQFDNSKLSMTTQYVMKKEVGAEDRESATDNYIKMGDDDARMTHDVSTYDTYDTIEHVTTEDEVYDRRSEVTRARQNAERGPHALQTLSFFAGMVLVFGSIVDFQWAIEGAEAVPPEFFMVVTYTWIFGVFIMALEGRAVLLNIASLHSMVSNYFKILRFLWGRGLFLAFVGSLEYSLGTSISIYIGIAIMALGGIMFLFGMIYKVILNRKLDKIPQEDELQSKFNFFDADKDGFINREEFRDLIISMKLDEFEEIDFDVEFVGVDLDSDGLASFPDVVRWVDSIRYRNHSLMSVFENAAIFIV